MKRFTCYATDHAILRYMERVHGIDVDRFRRELEDLLRPAAEAGVTRVRGAGLTWKLDNGRIVTVMATDKVQKFYRRTAK